MQWVIYHAKPAEHTGQDFQTIYFASANKSAEDTVGLW